MTGKIIESPLGKSAERQKRNKMAHKKGQGSTQNNRDSAGRRLGVKKYGGESYRDWETDRKSVV